MKELSKDVILDLLPLYLAGEVSEETAALVKKHLESDSELAEAAKEMAKADSLGKVLIPFKKESAMETFNEAKKWMTIRVIGVAAIVGLVLMCMFFGVMAGTIVDKLTPLFMP